MFSQGVQGSGSTPLEQLRVSMRTGRFPDIMSELLIDLLKCLASPNMDLRRRILELSMDLTVDKNVEKAVQFLKKEVLRTQVQSFILGAIRITALSALH